MGVTPAVSTALDLGDERVARWDELAIEARRPHSAPAWLTAWWEQARPARAQLALITASEGSELVGVMPLFSRRGHLAPLGDGLMPVEPVAAAGREREAAAAFAAALDGLAPRTLTLELQDDSPDWPALLAESWPGGDRPWRRRARVSPAPRVELANQSFEQWFDAKSANFRKDVRRKAKRIEKDGGSVRVSDAASLDADLDAFLALHLARHPRGSELARPGVVAMLREVGAALLPRERFRLVLVELDGRAQAAIVFSAAGDRVSAWNSGMGEGLARHSPVMRIFVAELEDMAARGERTMDLGPGEYGYKRRLASVDGTLTTEVLVPPGRGQLRNRGAYQARERAREATIALRSRVGSLARAAGLRR